MPTSRYSTNQYLLHKQWVENHPDAIKQHAKKKYKKNQKLLEDIKECTPCQDCNTYYPHYVMTFDHYLGVKRYNVGAKLGSVPDMLAEMLVCELVCANCHAVRTYRRKHEQCGSSSSNSTSGKTS